MSFLNDILDVGSSVWDWATGSSASAGLARAAALGLMLRELTASTNSENQSTTTTGNTTAETDAGVTGANGVRLQVKPDTNYKIPVVYGSAWLGGIVTDAQLSEDKSTMYFCLTICEKTGNILSLANQPSRFSFGLMNWDGVKLSFQGDGFTVKQRVDTEGTVDESLNGLVKIYCYAGNSETLQTTNGYQPAGPFAYNVMPGWTKETHMMEDTIFAIVVVKYDAEKQVTGLGTVDFQIKNTMKKPGDCIYDYMTNARYGAGLDPSEVSI